MSRIVGGGGADIDPHAPARSATTDGDGAFVLPALASGDVFIMCRGTATGSAIATVPEGGEASVEIPSYRR
jgi:hypothetical protein